MPQIYIVAEMRIKPGFLAEVMDVLKNMEAASRAEPGNIDYNFTMDVEDPDHLFVLETWASDKAIAAHNASEHFKEYVKAMEGKRLDHSVTRLVKLF